MDNPDEANALAREGADELLSFTGIVDRSAGGIDPRR